MGCVVGFVVYIEAGGVPERFGECILLSDSSSVFQCW